MLYMKVDGVTRWWLVSNVESINVSERRLQMIQTDEKYAITNSLRHIWPRKWTNRTTTRHHQCTRHYANIVRVLYRGWWTIRFFSNHTYRSKQNKTKQMELNDQDIQMSQTICEVDVRLEISKSLVLWPNKVSKFRRWRIGLHCEHLMQ